jgi:hypothetical protein
VKDERSTGGSRPKTWRYRLKEDEWQELLAEKKVPAEGRRVPSNILRKPLELPPMERVQK